MGAIWIAGILLFLVISVVLTLALCRSAAMADKDTEIYMPDGDQSRYYVPGHSLSSADETPATGPFD